MTDQAAKSSFEAGGLGPEAYGRHCTRRGLLQGVAAAGVLAALGPVVSACGGSSSSSGSPSTVASASSGPKKGGQIRSGIGGGSAKDTLDAHTSTTEAQIVPQLQVFESLMTWDADAKLAMVLAESYEANADATQHTVKLKPDVTFNNGRPVTADDVVYTFQRILDPKTGAIGTDGLVGLSASGIKKIDDLTVQFTLDQTNVIFYEALAYYNNAIVPTDYDPTTVEGAIGTGPWKITSFAPGEQTEFAANTSYHGEGPYADTLTVLNFSDPTAKLNALLGGTVDHISLVESSQAAAIQSSSGMQLLKAPGGGWEPITMRIDAKPFDDVRVRQAFRLLVDREQMIQQARGGFASLGNDMYAKYDPGYPSDLPQRAQDLEQAKSLLKQAGYDNDLTVEFVTSTAVGAAAVQGAQVFAQQAKGAGVTVNVKKVDPAIFYGDDYLKWPLAQDFWGTRNYLAQTQLGTLTGAPYNECHWKDAEWQALIDQAFKTVDETKRNDLVSQAEAIEYERGGYIIWAYNVLLDAHVEKLQGLLANSWGATSACKAAYNLMYFA